MYAMRVTEILSTPTYWSDSRFQHKKPSIDQGWVRVAASGDNIYEFHQNRWRQLHSYHSHKDGTQNEELMEKDVSVPKVLVSDKFVYFGGEGPFSRPNFVKVEK